MMGDRDYMRQDYRFGGAPARQGPSLVAIIIWINIAVFLLQMLGVWMVTPEEIVTGEAPAFLESFREAVPDGGLSRWALQRGEIYRLITYMFVHEQSAFPFHIIGNMLLVYFAGRHVLNMLGPRHFLAIYFIGGILGALAQLAVGETYLIGASAGAFALLCAFATLMPEMELLMLLYFVLPVRLRAKYLALGVVGISLAFLLVDAVFDLGGNIAHLAHLGGALLGWYYVRALGYGGRTVSLADLRKKRAGQRAAGGRRGGWTERFSGKSDTKVVDAKVVGDQPDSESVSEQVDRVLDKINREGFQSLTREERLILEEGSDYINRRVNRR